MASSGHGDVFESNAELAATARSGIYINEHATPSMERFSPGQRGFESNAYVYDFYMVSTLAAVNGIRPGDVWYELCIDCRKVAELWDDTHTKDEVPKSLR